MSDNESRSKSADKKRQQKGLTHEGLDRLTNDRLGQVTGKFNQTTNKAQQNKPNKRRTHSHYHSHDVSDHDHV